MKKSMLSILGVLLLSFTVVGGVSAGSPSKPIPVYDGGGGSGSGGGGGGGGTIPPTLERP